MENRHQIPINSYVDHEALSLDSEDLAHLESILKEVDWRTLTQNVSYLSTREFYSRAFGGESVDGFIIRNFMESKLENLAMREVENGGKIVTKFSLSLIALTGLKLRVVKKDPGHFTEKEQLGESLLTGNDIANSDSVADPASPEAQAAMVRHISLETGETTFCRLTRYYQLLNLIPETLPVESDWKDVQSLYRAAIGFDSALILGLAFGVFSVYTGLAEDINKRWRGDDSIPAPEASEWILDSRTFLKKKIGLTPETSHELISKLSTDPAHYNKEASKSVAPFDFTHLKTWPIINFGDTRFCVPVVDYLIDRITIGAYFDILDDLSSEQEKQDFGGFFGKVVERYVHLLLEDMLGPPGSDTGRWFQPEQYERDKGTPEGPDAIIVGNQGAALSAIFIEVKSSRPNREVVVTGDLSRLMESWRRDLIGTNAKRKATRQLDRAIDDFRLGSLRIPGIEQSKVATVYPIVITLDPWPLIFEVFESFENEVASLGLLKQVGTLPLDLWSCFDLETLIPRIINGDSLFDIVRDRPKGKEKFPLYYQLTSKGGSGFGNSPLLDTTWKLMTDAFVDELNLEEADTEG